MSLSQEQVEIQVAKSASHSRSFHAEDSRSFHAEENKMVPTKENNGLQLSELYQKFCERYPNWDLYMIFELFVFLMSFFFLVGESKDDDVRGAESSYLYQVNTVLIIDFLFRLLSIEIESIKREYWNHVLHCILPLIMWLLAAFYKFDNVFGSDPIKVLNALLFTLLNVIVIVVIVLKFITMDKLKGLCGKKEEQEQEPENNMV